MSNFSFLSSVFFFNEQFFIFLNSRDRSGHNFRTNPRLYPDLQCIFSSNFILRSNNPEEALYSRYGLPWNAPQKFQLLPQNDVLYNIVNQRKTFLLKRCILAMRVYIVKYLAKFYHLALASEANWLGGGLFNEKSYATIFNDPVVFLIKRSGNDERPSDSLPIIYLCFSRSH